MYFVQGVRPHGHICGSCRPSRRLILDQHQNSRTVHCDDFDQIPIVPRHLPHMDLLALPQNPIHPKLEARLRDAEEYDGLEFISYPERQGWRARSVGEWVSIFTKRPTSFVTFLERWLLFGPLTTFFARNCKASDFIRFVGDPAYPIFTLRYLQETKMPNEWKAGDESISADSVPAFTMGLQVHAHLAANQATPSRGQFPDSSVLSRKEPLIRFLEKYPWGFADPRDMAIVIATTITLEHLVHLAQRGSGSPRFPFHTSLGAQNLMWTLLRRNGWCPFEIDRFTKHMNTASMYYLYNLLRPKPHEQHQMIRVRGKSALEESCPAEFQRAQLCTPFWCAHRQLRGAEYETKHVAGCKGCDDVVADSETLCSIVKKGIPLIYGITDDDDDPNIFLIEGEADLPYVAISHVWSDGLGNLDRNALPRCQLLRLSQMVRDLPGENCQGFLLWCDTICIPPDSAGIHDVQALAIGKMHEIYSKAEAVLVLDSWLFECPMQYKSDIEICMKIISCTWTTRLWTYQEGALAHALYFQFSDGAYNLDLGMRKVVQLVDTPSHSLIAASLIARYQVLRGFVTSQARANKIVAIENALADRTTSVATDEALCLAVLLDLDVTEIARTEPTRRMEKIWRMLSKIPRDLLFTEKATLEVDGLRWAPVTFLKSPSSDSTHSAYDAMSVSREAQGALIQANGIRFHYGSGRIGDSVALRCANGSWYRVFFHRRSPDGFPMERYTNDGSSAVTDDPYEVYGCEEVAVIPNGPECEAEYLKYATYICMGILVGIGKEDENVIYCRRMLPCVIIKYSALSDQDRIRNLEASIPPENRNDERFCGIDKRDGAVVISYATLTPTAQRWCIG